jgi:glycosyltransferase involved in cell wall biosynthesis
MPKVLVLTRYDRLGASSRVRFLQFLPKLMEHGFTFDVRPMLSDDYLQALYGGSRVSIIDIMRSYGRRLAALTKRHQYDLVWLEKEALPWIPAWFEAGLLAGVPYVVDLDDAWFHRYENHPRAAVRALLGHKIDAIMSGARVVVAGNQYLMERARRAGARDVEIIPTVIDIERYPPPPLAPDINGARPTIVGWIGTPLNAHYLNQIVPALRQLTGTTSIKLDIVGASAPKELAGIPTESISWSEATEIERICDFDIGIMPLEDSPWERGKCAYKLLQAMAAAKPVVASNVGANRQVVRHGINGFLAETLEDWTEYLGRLSADPALRYRIGLEAFRTVNESYSVAAVMPRLAAMLERASQRSPRKQ